MPGEMSRREQHPPFLLVVPLVLQQPLPHSVLPQDGRGVRVGATVCELSVEVLSWLQSTACAPLGPRRGLPSSRQHPDRWVGLGRRCPSAQVGAPTTLRPTTGPGWLQSGSLLASAVSLKSCSCLFPRSDTETRPGAVPRPTRGKEERSPGGWVRHPPAASARPAVPLRDVALAGKVNPL